MAEKISEPATKDKPDGCPTKRWGLWNKPQSATEAPRQSNGINQGLEDEEKIDRVIALICQKMNEMQAEIAGIQKQLKNPENVLAHGEALKDQEQRTPLADHQPDKNSEVLFLPPTDSHIYCISKEVVKEWKELSAQLGLTQADVNEIDVDCIGCQEKALQALVRWRQRKASFATVERLVTALNNVGRRDVSEILKRAIDNDFSGATPSEVNVIMVFLADCLREWKKKREQEVSLFNELESLDKDLEEIENVNGGPLTSPVLDDCWSQNNMLKQLISKLNGLTNELVKSAKPPVIEKVFDLLIGVRETFNCTSKKIERLRELKTEGDEQIEMEALRRIHCQRLKDMEQTAQRFEAAWEQEWRQLQLHKTQSEPAMSRKENLSRKVRREHTVHTVPNSSSASYASSNCQNEDMQVLFLFRQDIMRMISEND